MVKMPIHAKFVHRFNAVLFKIPVSYTGKYRQDYSKMHMARQRNYNDEAILKRGVRWGETFQYLLSGYSVQDHAVKKEFTGPGLHLRPVHANHARPPFQWTLTSVFSAYENNHRRIRPPPDRGTLKIVSRLLIA